MAYPIGSGHPILGFNTMSHTIGSGAHIFGIANKGISVSSALIQLGGPRYHRFDDVAMDVSEMATLLAAVGRTMEAHEKLFKHEDFYRIFGGLLLSFEAGFDKLLSAVQKAKEYVAEVQSEHMEQPEQQEREDGSDDGDVGKMSLWKKFKKAFGGEDALETFMNDKKDDFQKTRVLQGVLNLAVLQSIGRRQDLTISQKSELAALKGDIIWLLARLREADLVSIDLRAEVPSAKTDLSFRNCSAETLPCTCTCDGSHLTADQTAKLSERLKRLSGSLGGSTKASTASISVASSIHEEVDSAPPPEPQVHYEAWALHPAIESKTARTTLFGVRREATDIVWKEHYDAYAQPATQDALKEHISAAPKRETNVSKFGNMFRYNAGLQTTVGWLIKSRHEACRDKGWRIELVAEMPDPQKSWLSSKFSRVTRPSYLVVLKGSDGVERLPFLFPTDDPASPRFNRVMPPRPPIFPSGLRGRPPPPPPPIGNGRGNPNVVIVKEKRRPVINWMRGSARERKEKVKFTLTQREAEQVVNDFLALFSTLYDDVPLEKRSAVLDSVALPAQYDDESDASSFTTDTSLGDD